MRNHLIKVLVILLFVSCGNSNGNDIAARNREQSRLFMRKSTLKMALKNNPKKFFQEHIAEKFTTYDGLKPVRVISVKVMQIIDARMILATTSDYTMLAVKSIDTTNLTDGKYVDIIPEPDGTYEYITVFGANKRIPAFKPGRTIEEQYFMLLLKEGFDFVEFVMAHEAIKR
jgi:hypothetical protein